MILLAADTSGKYGSLALARCGPEEACEILEVVSLTGGTFSAQFIPQVATLLANHGLRKENIDAFAVVSGPGSFTGLRVGLATVKALAEVLAKPIAKVSLLEAVARASKKNGKVLAALDAGRGEVYAAKYGSVEPVEERLVSRDELRAMAEGSTLVTPDETLAEIARSVGARTELIERPRSDSVARLGWLKILAGDTVQPENLEANYIRRSDAEIFAKPATK